MKILVIGDIHGRNDWEKYVKEDNLDKIIFLGDYVDSFNKTNDEIYVNLENIILFKKNNMDKVILLIGNHDIQYMLAHPNEQNNIYECSGYRPEAHFDLYDLFNRNKDIFQACYQIDKNIFSHAGITQNWFHNRFYGKIHEPIDEQINDAFKLKYEPLFDVGYRRGGYLKSGGIFWADKYDLINDRLNDFKQIIGHTEVNNIEIYENLMFCDTGDKMLPVIIYK